ncbi:MAG: tetratricopeptide repeat protein [Chloroflexota bacterium]|nr:tetratricopeptide repeat protein [Chloroflexota bacterium]
MSDISLRDYLKALDQLIEEGSADEVLWHARHILQHYPRNVNAYRFVGRALLGLGRWDEASAVLRRVLSVLPDDKDAHRLLSEINIRRNRQNEAIWHMERAFERDPGDREIVNELQRMYREYRGVANPRVQLTTAAVARQNIRAGEFDRAVETLRSALSRSPSRADLRVLLAEALWQHGEQIEAAETALDVLQSYPDSLVANRMLATLWLQEGRPSDAQPYLNRVEAIDPYLALELVRKQPVADDMFQLPELDYQQRAQAEMSAARPDWLSGIDAAAPAETSVETGALAESSLISRIISEPEPQATAEPSLEDDWLTELDAIDLNYNVNTAALQAMTGALDSYDQDEDAETPPMLTDVPKQTDTLGIEWASLDDIEATPPDEDPMAWLKSMDVPEATPDEASGPNDPLAWMKNQGIEIVDEAPLDPSRAQTSELTFADPNADPMGWLQDYDPDMLARDAEQADAQQMAADDPFALSMQDTDEVPAVLLQSQRDAAPQPSEDDSDFEDFASFVDLDDQPLTSASPRDIPRTTVLPGRFDYVPASAPAESLDDWELAESLLDESLGLEALSDSVDESAFTPETDMTDLFSAATSPSLAQTNPLPRFSTDEWAQFDAAQPPQKDNFMSDQSNPEFDWKDDDLQPADETPSTGSTGMLDWLSGIGEDPTEERLDLPENPPPDATGATGTLAWLGSAENPAYGAPPPEPTPEPSTGSTGMINWLSQNRPVPPTMPLSSAEMSAQGDYEELPEEIPSAEAPDWLYQLEDEEQPYQAQEIPPAPPAYDLPVTTGEGTGATDMLDWLSSAEVSAQSGMTGELAGGSPEDEWLAAMYEDAGIEAGASTPGDASPGAVEWEQEAQTWHEDVTGEVPAVALTDFMSQVTPEPEAQPMAENPDWLSDEFDFEPVPAPEPELPPAVTSELPGTDWLTGSIPHEEAAPSEPDWLSGDYEDEEESPVAAEVPSASITTGWLSNEDETEAEAPLIEEPASAEPNWLMSDFEPQVEAPVVEEPVSASAEPDWLMSDFEPQAQAPVVEEPASASAEPDWLMSDFDPQTQAPVVEEAVAAWDAELEPEPVAAEDDDWFPSTGELSPQTAEDATPDWMREPLGAYDTSVDDLDAEPVAELYAADLVDIPAETAAEVYDANVNVEAGEEGLGDVVLDIPEEQGVPTWMSDVAPVAETEGLEDTESAQFVHDLEAASEADAQPSGLPDWLMDAAPIAAGVATVAAVAQTTEPEPLPTLETEPGDWDFDTVEPEIIEPDMLTSAEAVYEDELVAETDLFEEEAAPVAAQIETFDDDFALEEDSTIMTPAENAPDWLNAMVPGLDIDTHVGESDAASEETAEETTAAPAPAMPDDYGWLNEVVDEETRADAPVAAVAARAPRFIFSRPPLWLRRLLEQREQTVNTDDDLPAWLR